MQSRAIWYLKHSRQVSNVVSTQLHRTTTILCAERLNRVSTFEQCRSRGSSQQSEIAVQATHNLWTSYVMPSRRELEYNTVTVLDALCHRLPHYKHGSSMRNGFRTRTAQELLMADNAKRAKEPKRSTVHRDSNKSQKSKDQKIHQDWLKHIDGSKRCEVTKWLKWFKRKAQPDVVTKSSIMLGLGETDEEIQQARLCDVLKLTDSVSAKPSLTCIHILNHFDFT